MSIGKLVFVGNISRYQKILYGVNGLFAFKKDKEEEESEYVDNTGGEYFLAFHQWNTYKSWLSFHPAEEESFRRFETGSHPSWSSFLRYCNRVLKYW